MKILIIIKKKTLTTIASCADSASVKKTAQTHNKLIRNDKILFEKVNIYRLARVIQRSGLNSEKLCNIAFLKSGVACSKKAWYFFCLMRAGPESDASGAHIALTYEETRI